MYQQVYLVPHDVSWTDEQLTQVSVETVNGGADGVHLVYGVLVARHQHLVLVKYRTTNPVGIASQRLSLHRVTQKYTGNLGTCELAVCVRIEYESKRALMIRIHIKLAIYNTFQDGPTVAISITIQFVHCSSAGLPHTKKKRCAEP